MAFQALENSLLLAVLLGIPHICAFEIPDVCSCECFVDGSLVHTKNGNKCAVLLACLLALHPPPPAAPMSRVACES